MDMRILCEHGRPYTDREGPTFARLIVADQQRGLDARQAVRRLPASAFEPYGLGEEQVDALVERLLRWAEEIGAGQ
jgi:hypothetical protein